jgi:hypothetical protein
METKPLIQARLLTRLQLQMLDIGAPVIVSCKTLTGETVAVRLQTANLEPEPEINPGTEKRSVGVNNGHGKDCWQAHGVYVAVMPNGSWE